MDIITRAGFLGPSQNIQYRLDEKLRPCVKKGPEAFSPQSITPRCHSFAA